MYACGALNANIKYKIYLIGANYNVHNVRCFSINAVASSHITHHKPLLFIAITQ